MNIQNFLSSIQNSKELEGKLDLSTIQSIVIKLEESLPKDYELLLKVEGGEDKVSIIDTLLKLSCWHTILQDTYLKIQIQHEKTISANMISVLERRLPLLQTLYDMDEDFI